MFLETNLYQKKKKEKEKAKRKKVKVRENIPQARPVVNSGARLEFSYAIDR
jgi:hypothetical protein